MTKGHLEQYYILLAPYPDHCLGRRQSDLYLDRRVFPFCSQLPPVIPISNVRIMHGLGNVVSIFDELGASLLRRPELK